MAVRCERSSATSPGLSGSDVTGVAGDVAPLRVGVIGLGVGEQHIIGYEQHPACEVVALCDSDVDRLKEVGRRHAPTALTSRADEVIQDPSIDIVSIATYDDVHAEQVIRAIEHGKHVFVEKPLCMGMEEARRIRAALGQRPNVRLSSNLILRVSPRFAAIKRRIDDGLFGSLFHIEADYNYGRLHKITDGWRGRLEHYSVVLGGAVHMVDLLLWLTGGRAVEVSAYGNNIATRGCGFRDNDMVVAILRFESGLTAKVTANFGCVLPHGHGLTVYGTGATFIQGDPHGRLYTSRDPQAPPELIVEPHPATAKGALIDNFIGAILGQRQPIVSEQDVFETMSVCLAIERSLRDGRPVRVTYV
ncbi:MAG: Gfo/Idh/MocA family oxidoreductase [Planctomycetes bacterium]|nr:Gfo/Idh/MocA family oxidoreductase [Planctomycetota bacterium]